MTALIDISLTGATVMPFRTRRTVPVEQEPACHHRQVAGISSGDSPLQIDPARSRQVSERWVLHGRSFLYVLIALVAVIGLAGLVGDRPAGASPTAPTMVPTAVPTTMPTLPQLTLEDGTFTAPDGSFAVGFAAVPSRVIDADNEVTSFLLGVQEDTQSVVIFRPTALGAPPGATPSQRVELFLDASGTDIEALVNTPTRLGPFDAAHFIARLTLGNGHRAVVYGLEVTRQKDVVYVFYTDIGGDDNEAASTFVQSFTLMMVQPPTTTTSTTSTSSTTFVTTTTSTTSASTVASSTDAPPSTAPPTDTAPEGATVAYDGRWWVTFPDGSAPTFRASTADGFAYAEYVAVDGDDTSIVRVTEVPAGYEWLAAEVADATAHQVGGVVRDAAIIDFEGREAVRFTLHRGESTTPGDTIQVLTVNGGDQLYTISFVDGGVPSTDDAEAFIETFELSA